MRSRSLLLAAILVAVTTTLGACSALELPYQESADQLRSEDVNHIALLVTEFHKRTGRLPFQATTADQPVMVLIGHTPESEIEFGALKVMDKGAVLFSSADFLATLREGLGVDVELPRDPQKVTTFAPNVYIYFAVREPGNPDPGFCTGAHLYSSTPETVQYTWEGGTFHSLLRCWKVDGDG